MNVTSPGFVLGTLIASAIIWHLPAGGPRRWAFSILCVLFLATQMISWAGWCVLAIFLLSGHLMGRWMATKPDGRALTIYLLAIIVAFVYLKNYCFLTVLLPDPWLNRTVIVVGLSYMFFRQIHYLVDSAQGQIEHATFWTYLNYQLHPFGLLAGPIQRFQDFAAYWNEPISILADRHEVLMALLRFFVGIFKVTAIGTFFLEIHAEAFQKLGEGTAGSLAAISTVISFVKVFYTYPLYLYFNFSGYCDVVIAAAALLGLRMPENFDHPYLARNILDLWTRWHRTLGFWIRDYVFTPLYKSIAQRRPRQAASYAFACYFIAFFLVGMWHGTTANWMVFALFHGSGAAAAKLWESYLTKRYGRAGYKNYMASNAARFAAVLMTSHYFCFSILFCQATMEKCLLPLRALVAAVL